MDFIGWIHTLSNNRHIRLPIPAEETNPKTETHSQMSDSEQQTYESIFVYFVSPDAPWME